MAKAAIFHNNIDKTRNYILQRENVVGRAPDCNIFSDSKSVSRRHARVAAIAKSDHYFIEDICARGVYVNFKRIRGRHPLKEADRVCILKFHNVHPVELDRMKPDELRQHTDDPRNHNLEPIVDLTFGYVDAAEHVPGIETPGSTAKEDVKPKGLFARIKAVFGESSPPPPKPAKPQPLAARKPGEEPDAGKKKKKKKKDAEANIFRGERYKL